MNAPAKSPMKQTCRMDQLPYFLERITSAGLVPFIRSAPGIGKSAAVKQFAKTHRLKMIDHRMSTSPPEDLTGLPEFYNDENGERRARSVPFGDLFPIEGDKIPDGYDGWVIFLDEFNSASRETIAASYKLILDRMVGQKNLHSNVMIILAGNRMEDKAIVNDVGTAAQSRVVHLLLEAEAAAFLAWGFQAGLDSRVLAYISQYKEAKLMDFNPNHTDNTFCCPRTWEAVSKLIYGHPIHPDDIPMLTGTITSAVAIEFMQFTAVFGELLQVEDILRDPMGCKVLTGSHAYAQMTILMEHLTMDNFAAMLKYIQRLDITVRVMFIRNCNYKMPSVSRLPAYSEELIKYAAMSR